MRVLVVEHDGAVGSGLAQGLTADGYAVDLARDVESAEAALKGCRYGMMALDFGLPDGSGPDILKSLRSEGNDMPVLVLSACDDVDAKVRALDAGADDYMVKPFRFRELSARLRALRRRCGQGRAEPLLKAGDVALDPASRRVEKAGAPVSLGAKEFSLLHMLMERQGQALSKSRIEESLYGWGMEIESNAVEVHVHGIRKKLGKELIETVKHVGYRIRASG
jgi:two-component system response regulator QseB